MTDSDTNEKYPGAAENSSPGETQRERLAEAAGTAEGYAEAAGMTGAAGMPGADGASEGYAGAPEATGASEGYAGAPGATGASEGYAGAPGAFSNEPPFALPASLRPESHSEGSYTETWKATSDSSCQDVARELLLELRDSGMELVKADYLDLFGEAWGCTLEERGEASLTIILVPEKPFAQRSASNQLRMTLIRTTVPEQALSGAETGGT
jgi:hypothetical protein